MRAPQFRPSIYRQGTRVRWRVFIPASLSADGTRHAVYYDTKSEALDDAARLRELHARGEIVQSAVLTASQRNDAAAAVAALAAAGLNMSLAECAQLAIEQRARMARGCSLAALLDAYEQEVAPARGWSAPYLRSWRGYARKLADAYGGQNIANITTQMMIDFLSGNFGKSASYYNTALAVISPVFEWAARREFLDKNPCNPIERRKSESADSVDFFSIAEVQRLLRACKSWREVDSGHPMYQAGDVAYIYRVDCTDCLIPFAFLLFAGVRPEELQKLNWDDVFDDGDGMAIHVRPSIAKTRQVRNIHVRPALRAFIDMLPESERTGSIAPKNWKRKAAVVRKAAGLDGRPDAPRHTFATYALAAREPLAVVQDDMGHAKGSDMTFKHYRAIASRLDAAAFWGIRPADVIQQ